VKLVGGNTGNTKRGEFPGQENGGDSTSRGGANFPRGIDKYKGLIHSAKLPGHSGGPIGAVRGRRGTTRRRRRVASKLKWANAWADAAAAPPDPRWGTARSPGRWPRGAREGIVAQGVEGGGEVTYFFLIFSI